VRQIAGLVALIALFASSAAAQPKMPLRAEDHLEPDSSILGGSAFMASYDMQVQRTFREAYGFDVAVRMVALPSFVPEYAVGLVSKAKSGWSGPYRIFALTPAASLWTYQIIAMLKDGSVRILDDKGQKEQKKEIARLQASVPSNPDNLKVARCEADISDALGGRILKIWRAMLMRTRYPQQNMNGADGVAYHFSMSAFGPLSGKVWSPDRNSSIGTLVTLADEMYDICTKKKDASMDQLEKLTAELEHRLK
jgi:hypothetical protein